MLGDCYTAAIVEHWSQGELQAMDAEASTENHYPTDVEKAADLTPLVTRHHDTDPDPLLHDLPVLLKGRVRY